MSKLEFSQNLEPTIGVEIELGLVDARTMELRSGIEEVLARLPSRYRASIKPELMQCYLEINSGVCRTVDEAEQDLRPKIAAVEETTDELGLGLLWSATHPFSCWKDQQITSTERYYRLVDLLEDMARQLVTFGLHVHVGVDSGDKAVAICDRIMPHLPTLLALSCNSPCWDGRITGLQSSRSKVMEGLPTAGLPFAMRNWSEYTWLVSHLIETGFIHTIREIWWDVRPHHNFGTVEVRVCDIPGSFEDVLALTALIQCLVKSLSDEIDNGIYLPEAHPMMVRQNKWRACRYGPRALLVDPRTHESMPVPQVVEGLLQRLRPTADELGCRRHLERVQELASGPSWADRQLSLIGELGPVEAARKSVEGSRLTARREVAGRSWRAA